MLEHSASFQEGIKHRKQIEELWDSDPYPKGTNWKQNQAKYSLRPNCDPRETSIILFPGQGCIFLNFQM